MAQESTAIRDLIHLAHAKRIDDDPVPDLFSVPPSQPAVSLRPAAKGTPPPAKPQPAPSIQPMPYRIPTTVQREDEETEMRTSPAVPKILAAQPQARAVPSILSGPTAPQLQPRQQPVPHSHAVSPHAVAPGFHGASTKPRSATIAPKAPAPYLVARELASSAFRARGGIAALAVLALGVGIYLAVASSRGEATPQAPTERDRAIAIMNGTAQPEPSATAPVVAAIEPKPEAKPTAEPIEEPPTAQRIEGPVAEVADESVSVDEIEMEPAAARPAKRASRSSRKAKKTVAVVETQRTTRRSNDPVLAILEEKPVKKAKVVEKKKEAKSVKAPKNLSTTEIAAPRGAAAVTGTGKVTITSDKPALVFLDGRPTGKKAPTALVIPAGDHQITLLDPETKKAKTATIKLEANKSVAIAKLFN